MDSLAYASKLWSILRSRASLIKVLGAVIVFFSWVTDKGWKEGLSSKKNALESARREYLLNERLRQIHLAVNSPRYSELLDARTSDADLTNARVAIIGGSVSLDDGKMPATPASLEDRYFRISRAIDTFESDVSYLLEIIRLALHTETKVESELVEHYETLNNSVKTLKENLKKVRSAIDQAKNGDADARSKAARDVNELIALYESQLPQKESDRRADLFQRMKKHLDSSTEDVRRLSSRQKVAEPVFYGLYIAGSLLALLAGFLEVKKPGDSKSGTVAPQSK